MKFFLDSDGTRKEVLPPGHLLGHVEQEVLVCFVHAREQPTELAQHAGLFASAAPGGLQRRVKEINLLASVMEQKEPGKLQHLAAGNPKHRRSRGWIGISDEPPIKRARQAGNLDAVTYVLGSVVVARLAACPAAAPGHRPA